MLGRTLIGNGSDGSPLSVYDNWGTNEPNNHKVEEDSVTLLKVVWFNTPCDWKGKFIC